MAKIIHFPKKNKTEESSEPKVYIIPYRWRITGILLIFDLLVTLFVSAVCDLNVKQSLILYPSLLFWFAIFYYVCKLVESSHKKK